MASLPWSAAALPGWHPFTVAASDDASFTLLISVVRCNLCIVVVRVFVAFVGVRGVR